MSDILSYDGERVASTKDVLEPVAVECEFGVERIDGMGGMSGTRRVTFKGYATDAICAALVDAIGMVLTDESEEHE